MGRRDSAHPSFGFDSPVVNKYPDERPFGIGTGSSRFTGRSGGGGRDYPDLSVWEEGSRRDRVSSEILGFQVEEGVVGGTRSFAVSSVDTRPEKEVKCVGDETGPTVGTPPGSSGERVGKGGGSATGVRRTVDSTEGTRRDGLLPETGTVCTRLRRREIVIRGTKYLSL